jgi:hypothetical protein
VKSPWLCDYLDEALAGGEIVVDHAIVPMRDLYSAAESRRDVTKRYRRTRRSQTIFGGLWDTARPVEQETILVWKLYRLMYALAKHAVPVTLLLFPRLARDPEYLFRNIGPVLPGVDYASFRRGFQAASRPELIHEFDPGAAAIGDVPPPVVEPLPVLTSSWWDRVAATSARRMFHRFRAR